MIGNQLFQLYSFNRSHSEIYKNWFRVCKVMQIYDNVTSAHIV